MKMTMTLKVSDRFFADFTGDDVEFVSYDGYVPEFIPGGPGDYVEMTINLATGQIKDWTPVSDEQVMEIIDR